MIIVRYDGRVVALVRPPFVEFPGHIAALEGDHPYRRWAFGLGLFALDVMDGHVPGPYTEDRAGHFVRAALIPDHEFTELSALEDAILAQHFNVPLLEIDRKRSDLHAHTCA